MNMVNIAWLTVNRGCNLRCKWCYAKGTGYNTNDVMDINEAKKVLAFLDSIGVNKVVLIGGEPTIYPYIFELLDEIDRYGMSVSIPTNGVLFQNSEFVNKYKKYKRISFNVSLKGCSDDDYKSNTNFKEYDDVLIGISNVCRTDIKTSVSMVLSKENINDYLQGIRDAKLAGANDFSLSICYDFSETILNGVDYIEKNIQPVILGFMKSYEQLCIVTNEKFVLSQSLPLCLWDKDFINVLKNKRQISSVCQLLKHTGIIFDTDLSVIPCNSMYDIKIGKWKEDFFDKNSFYEFWESENIDGIFKKLRGIPDKECNECENLSVCGGGCVSNWLHFSYNDILKRRCDYE